MIEIVYYVHGSTSDNETKIATGWDQVPLSSKGIEQTQKAALLVDGSFFDAIYASDLTRAVESAKILFANRPDDIVIDQRLRECNYGSFTKRPNKELIYDEHIDNPFPSGESLRDVEKRIREFLKDIEHKNHRKVAIVGHRAPQLALVVITSNSSWEEAIENDWRNCGHWQPGWSYVYKSPSI
jgi:broad specificity phosphatase PhoE